MSTVTSGPTRGSEGQTAWQARAGVAFTIRAVSTLAPLVVAIIVSKIAASHLYRPVDWFGAAIWFAEVVVISTVVMIVTDRYSRRLLPMAALFKLSLVFPDEAPSRFSVALRNGTTKQLERRIDEIRRQGFAQDEVEAADQLLALVTSLGAHDRLTRGHTERVRAYANLIAEEMGLSRADQEKLHWSVLVHDIGKLTVPARILNKEEALTDEEWAVLQQHPSSGARMVEPLAPWLGDWRLAAGEHHERWDGKGYPQGLAGNQISLGARIVAVADAYDVITSVRSYKKATPPEAARQELVACAGAQFDPAVVRAFLNVSLGRLRLAMGPLAWLSHVPGLSSAPSAIAGSSGTAIIAAGGTMAAALAGLVATPPEPAEPVPVLAFAEEQPASPSSTTTTTGPPRTITTTTTTTTTTSPPTTTTGPRSAAVATPTPTPAPAPNPAPPPPPSTPSTTLAGPPPTPPPPTQPPAPGSAADDSYTVAEGTTTRMKVLDNDDPGAASFLDPTVITPPTRALDFYRHNDHFHYEADSEGTDSFVYEVCTTSGACYRATVFITIQED